MPDPTALDATRSAYDAVAADYARLLPDASAEAAGDLDLIARLADAVPAGGRILDAGCGTGRMVGHLASLGHYAVEGVDLSPGMVALARASHPAAGFTVADLAALPFPGGTFDAVLAWYAIIHTAPEDLAGVVAEFRRILRPHAPVLLGFQAGSGPRTIRRAYGHDVELVAHLHDVGHIAGLLERHGFTVDDAVRRRARPSERHPQGFVLARRR